MLKKFFLILFIVGFGQTSLFAQPYDFLLSSGDDCDALTQELRNLQAVQRDMAIEQLTKKPRQIDAYIELGELRLSQGKLLEAQRFFEMAKEINPDNYRVSKGLMMVYYKKGDFGKARNLMEKMHAFYPISSDLQEELYFLRNNVKEEYQFGIEVREDDRGLLDLISSVQAQYPSKVYKKISARYKIENCAYEDNDRKEKLIVYSASADYKLDKFSGVSFTYAPEVFTVNETMNSYSAEFFSGNENLKLSLSTDKSLFRSNVFTIRNRYYQQTNRLTLYGDLHRKTRIANTVTSSEISDSNSYKRFDTSVLHFVFKGDLPLFSVTLNYYNAAFQKQVDELNNNLSYWAPSDNKGFELTVSYEQKSAGKFWWGLDALLSYNSYSFTAGRSDTQSGFGAVAHMSYELPVGTVYFSLGDRIHEYFRERKLQFYTVISW